MYRLQGIMLTPSTLRDFLRIINIDISVMVLINIKPAYAPYTYRGDTELHSFVPKNEARKGRIAPMKK